MARWRCQDNARVCKECVQTRANAGTPWQCSSCKTWGRRRRFPRRKPKESSKRVRTYLCQLQAAEAVQPMQPQTDRGGIHIGCVETGPCRAINLQGLHPGNATWVHVHPMLAEEATREFHAARADNARPVSSQRNMQPMSSKARHCPARQSGGYAFATVATPRETCPSIGEKRRSSCNTQRVRAKGDALHNIPLPLVQATCAQQHKDRPGPLCMQETI